MAYNVLWTAAVKDEIIIFKEKREREKFVTSSVRFANCKNASLTLSIESWLISLFFGYRSRRFAAELSWRSPRTQQSIYRWKNRRYLISQFADCVKMRSINISRSEKVCFFRSLDANTTMHGRLLHGRGRCRKAIIKKMNNDHPIFCVHSTAE